MSIVFRRKGNNSEKKRRKRKEERGKEKKERQKRKGERGKEKKERRKFFSLKFKTAVTLMQFPKIFFCVFLKYKSPDFRITSKVKVKNTEANPQK